MENCSDSMSCQNKEESQFIRKLGLICYLRNLYHWGIRNKLNINEGDKVLEIGSGCTPYYEHYATKIGENGLFIPIDASESYQKKANKLLKTSSNIEMTVGNIQELPFCDESFDIVISNMASCTGRLMREEVFRVLKTGGMFHESFEKPFKGIPLLKKAHSEVGFEHHKTRLTVGAVCGVPLCTALLGASYGEIKRTIVGVGLSVFMAAMASCDFYIQSKKPE